MTRKEIDLRPPPKGLVVAGTSSGAGKTSISLALMAALRRRGMSVQAFKVGPDFIDPGHHTRVTGRPSHNLDGWMLSREENLSIFKRYAAGVQAVIVEGVMGLFDGFEALAEVGSTAQMAKWLELPVLLCADARSMARSLAALAKGFAGFDPGINWAGLVANRVGSANHIQLLSEVMSQVPEMPFRGGLVRTPEISLHERHLGLVTAEETTWAEDSKSRLVDWLENGLDLESLWEDLPAINTGDDAQDVTGSNHSIKPIRLGVARDEAFCFYYQEKLRRLEEAGAELVYFSPLRDRDLPPDLAGLYLGGGYPEVHAPELSQNRRLIEAVRDFGRAGKVIYAECGGFMYLTRAITDNQGRTWPMTGLLPVEVRMLERLKSLGYREVTLTGPTPLGPKGLVIRGHEFHYSEVSRSDPLPQVYQVTGRKGPVNDAAGFLSGNILASYVHLHFGSCPAAAAHLVAACERAA